MIDPKPRTDRGFRKFYEGDRFRVIESSLALEGAHAWVFGPGEQAIQVGVADAKDLLIGLAQFIVEAEADELNEPASYDAPHRQRPWEQQDAKEGD